MNQRHGKYTEDEVRELVEGYEELRTLRYKAWIHVRLIDLDRVLRYLPRVYREAIVLHGMVGLTTRAVGELVGASHTAVRKRYIRGLQQLVTRLNGGKP